MDKNIPTAENTVAEIKAYLDAQGIEYQDGMSKAKLLGLIPTVEDNETVEEEAPAPVPEVPKRPVTRYTKDHLVSSAKNPMKIYFIVFLEDNVTYTYQEALDTVEEGKRGI